jgi:hypothetical protein
MLKPDRLPGTALLAVALLAAAPGCGHKGDPLPPLRHTPPGLGDFRLAQRGSAIEVSLLTPAASVDGLPLESLVIEVLYAEGQKDLEKAGERREIPAAPRQRVVTSLKLPAPGTVVRAAARGVVGREKGQRTLTLGLVAQKEVEPPSDLSARLVADGVELAWSGAIPEPVSALVRPPQASLPFQRRPPATGVGPDAGPDAKPGAAPVPDASPEASRSEPGAGAPAPPGVPAAPATGAAPTAPAAAEPPLASSEGVSRVETPKSGFRVYRRLASGSYLQPLDSAPLGEHTLTDSSAGNGVKACYEVRAVASVDPLVESDPSNEVCLEVRDIAAPAAPSGLAVLPREAGLEVLWTPSPETDLAGYRVYRQSADEPRTRVAELGVAQTTWLDTTARPGVVYHYEVTAFDAAGNESPPAVAPEASVL